MVRNLGELVLQSAATHGDRLAYQMRRGPLVERITYRQAAERARSIAAWLADQGLAPGDRVGVWAPNMPEYALLYFGAWLAGVVMVPVDVRTRPEVVERFLTAAGVRCAFVSRALQDSFPTAICRRFVLEELFDLIRSAQPPRQLPEVGPESLCEIAYTSGTTGEPKGVMLSHGNVLASVEALREAFPLERDTRALSVLPLSHALEQQIGLLLALCCGAQMTYVHRLSPVTIARAMHENQITTMIVVPEVLRLILSGIERRVRQAGQERLWQRAHTIAPHLPFRLRRLLFMQVHRALGGHLRYFGCGGAPVDLKVAAAWERMGVHIYEGYGLTETAGAATINSRSHHRLGSAGRPLPGVSLRIADDGEVLVKGPSVTTGYYNNPELTAHSMADGWLRTGDVGHLDPDGFLQITGREAFKIVLADGRKVYPEDIEHVLSADPRLTDACVIGGGGDGGERVHAVLLMNAPERAAGVVRDANRRLGAHQQIRGYSIWPEKGFPRTPILKVDRATVRRAIAQPVAPGTVSTQTPAKPASDPLLSLVAQVAERPRTEMSDDAELEGDLGLDSLGRIELVSLIEEELGLVVDEAALGPQTTVGALRRLVDTGTEAGAPQRRDARWPRAWWARALRRLLLWSAFRLQDHWLAIEVVHPERAARIPRPALLIFNYEGPYVPLVMLRALPDTVRERVAIAADARLWQGRHRWQGWLAALGAQAIPLAKSGAGMRASLEELGRWLDDGYAVILSPEGDPEPVPEVQPFLGGVGLLAVETGVPVVPFRIEGYHRLFPQERTFPFLPHGRGRVRLTIGEAVTFPRTMPYQEATERARRALIETN